MLTTSTRSKSTSREVQVSGTVGREVQVYSMSSIQSPLVDGGAATNHDGTSSNRTAIAHLPQVYSLTWKDDFFDAIPAAVAVFDLNDNATISPPTPWFPQWNLCHLALTMSSILVVYQRSSLLNPLNFCQEGKIEYEYIPFDNVTEVTVNHDEGIVSLLHKHSDHNHSERWIKGLDRPEEFDHALVALQENFFRTKHKSPLATTT